MKDWIVTMIPIKGGFKIEVTVSARSSQEAVQIATSMHRDYKAMPPARPKK